MAKKKGKPAEIEEEIIYVSKSELKRDAQEFHQLGSEIAKMGKKQRERLPLNDDLKAAMVVADKISNKSDAYRRHLNYIAKTLRTVENVEEIKAIIDVMLNKNNQAEVLIKKYFLKPCFEILHWLARIKPESAVVIGNSLAI